MTTGTTSGGSYTNNIGYASAGLYTVNPQPTVAPYGYVPGPADRYYALMGGGSPSGLRKGFHWVWATTQGRGGRRVADSVLVSWVYPPISAQRVPSGDIAIPTHLSSAPVSITIKDQNGNPLPGGTKVITTVSYTTDVSGIKFDVTGDLSSASAFTIPDAEYAMFPGRGITDFTIYVNDLSVPSAITAGQKVTVQLSFEAPGGLTISPITISCIVL